MKKLFTNPWTYLVIAIIAAAIIFRDKIASWWNTPTAPNNPAPPAEGSACSLNGQAGTIVNGTCVPDASAERVILVPISSSRIGARRARCYSKPAGAMCEQRIYDNILGWGSLYSATNTTCCYIFR